VKLLKLKDPITGQKYNSIFIIVDKFTKWGYFIAYIIFFFSRRRSIGLYKGSICKI
jgi:hypothetical protein